MPGGTFDRDAAGELNGRVTDNAMEVFARVGKRPTCSAAQTLERERAGLAFMSKQFARYGLTSVCHEGGSLRALELVRAQRALKHRVSYEAQGAQLDAMLAAGMTTGLGDDWLKLDATHEHI